MSNKELSDKAKQCGATKGELDKIYGLEDNKMKDEYIALINRLERSAKVSARGKTFTAIEHETHRKDTALRRHQEREAKVQREMHYVEQALLASRMTNVRLRSLNTEIAAHKGQLSELRHQRIEFQRQCDQLPDDASASERRSRFERELYRFQPKEKLPDGQWKYNPPLPALAKRHQLIEAMRESPVVVVKGETGSGKSTQIPQYLAEVFAGAGKAVVCTQPRKVAAESLAERVAVEYAAGNRKYCRCGTDVGFHLGGRKKMEKGTKIIYTTDHVLLNQLLESRAAVGAGAPSTGNPLCNFSCLVIDEAHERSLHTDVLLGLLKQMVRRDPSLRIVITSATLDTAQFKQYFKDAVPDGNVPSIDIPGRLYPVSIQYCPLLPSESLVDRRRPNQSQVVVKALQIHVSDQKGDILVFLPTQRDCEVACQQLQRQLQKQADTESAEVFALHGGLTPREQQDALKRLPRGTRKIVFSTNLAETSLTIDGVRHVVDSGVENQMTYDSVRAMAVMQVSAISKSNATQRQGRAGRTSPGTCYRLYSEDDYDTMRTGQLPEILRKPMHLTILSLALRGLQYRDFDWLDAPAQSQVEASERELQLLGAIKAGPTGCQVTEFGRLCVDLELEPRIARIVFVGKQQGCLQAALKVAAVLGVADNVWWRGGDTKSMNQADGKKDMYLQQNRLYDAGDVVPLVRLFEQWLKLEYSPVIGDVSPGGDDVLVRVVSGVPLQDAEPEPEDENDEDEDSDFSNVLTAENLRRLQHSLDREYVDTTNSDPDESDASSVVSSVMTDAQGSDSGSIGSVGSSAGTETSTPAKQRRLSKDVVRRNRKAFCNKHSLNFQSLTYAEAALRDLKRGLQRTLKQGDGDFAQEDDREASSEDLQKLFFAGHFLNTASLASEKPGGVAQYDCMEAEQMGFPHPSSAIGGLKTPLKWLAYCTLSKSSRTFLKCCSPCNPDWLKEVATAEYIQEFSKLRQRREWQEESIGPLSRSLVSVVFGKRLAKLEEIEKATHTSISVLTEGQHTGMVRFWARRDNLSAAKATFQRHIESASDLLKNEYHEELVGIGSTRAVYGVGGTVKMLLLGCESISVNISNLPPGLNEDAVVRLLNRNDRVSRAADWRVDIRPLEQETSARVAVMDPAVAKELVDEFDQETIDGKVISVRLAGIRCETQHSFGDARMRVTWALGKSKGLAVVAFRRAEHAAAANGGAARQIQHLLLPRHSIQMDRADRCSVFIQGLRETVDEIDLRRALSIFGPVDRTKTKVLRNDPSGITDEEHLLFQAQIQSLLTTGRPDDVLVRTTDHCHHESQRAGEIVRFKSSVLALSRAEEINRAGLTFNGQPVRAEARITHVQVCEQI